MPEYLSPGTYIEEIAPTSRRIEGASTSTAAFLGETERGPTRPTLVTSQVQFERLFGGNFGTGKYLPYAIRGFFENGGRRAYICRVVGRSAMGASRAFGEVTLRALNVGGWGNRIFASIDITSNADGDDPRFRLRMAYWPDPIADFEPFDPFAAANGERLPRPAIVEEFDGLSSDPSHADYYERRVGNPSSPNSALAWLDNNGIPAAQLTTDAGWSLLLGGEDDDEIDVSDFVGSSSLNGSEAPRGLAALELSEYDEVALVYAPHAGTLADDVHRAIISHCEQNRFRLAVLDCDPRQLNVEALNPQHSLPSVSSYAAFYCPWLIVSDSPSGARIPVPPGGHVLGIYARTDIERGVFKAPANEVVRGVLDVEHPITDHQQGTLNPRGVNVIRQFQGRGIRVWGARTLSSDPEFKYVSARRLLIFLEHSVYTGTQWVAFEPNDEQLWARVRDTIHPFLRSQWTAGALLGPTEEEAFFIKCDRTTMSEDDILQGRLICLIGVATIRRGEFTIFRITQQTTRARD